MIQRKKRVTLLLCSLLVALIFSGCSSSEGGAGTVELNFVSSNNTHGTSLDPAIEYNGARNVTIGVGETLFKLNDDTLDVENHLASDYEHIDELTWKITIREGITFSNGKPLTAESVKNALDYSLAGITRLATMLDINSIQANGDVLTITTNNVVATLPRILTDISMFIFDTDGTDNFGEGVIGTGPYILESMDSDGNSELVKNENYWQGVPGADRVHTKFISDNTAVTQALQSGELDYATIQGSDIELFENNDDYEVLDYETGRVYFLYLNTDFTFTQDPALRNALTYAFDRESYLNAIYAGRGKSTTTIFPLWSGYSNKDVSQNDYNIEKAKQILQTAGYEDTDGDGFLEKDGGKVFLNITCYPSNGFSVLSQALQASLKEIGIDSEIIVSDSIVADLDKGNFNIATYGYTTLTLGDSFNFLDPVFKTNGSSNFNHFSSPDIDAILEELKATSDPEARKQLSIEMQKYIYEEDEHIFLTHINTYNVVRKGVKNVTTGVGDPYNLWRVTK